MDFPVLQLVLLLSATLLVACSPEKLAVTDGSSTGVAGPTTSSPTTGGSTGTGEPACAPGPVAGDIECVPPGATEVSWFLDGVDAFTSTFDAQCTTAAVIDDGAQQTLSLDCTDNTYELRLTTATPHVAVELMVGATVDLHYQPIPNGEIEDSAWFALRDATGLLAAGIDGPLTALTLAPLQYELRSTTCESQQYACTIAQRAAFEVWTDDASIVLFDGHASTLAGPSPAPDYQVLVGKATREHCSVIDIDPGCNTAGYSLWSVRTLFIRASDQ